MAENEQTEKCLKFTKKVENGPKKKYCDQLWDASSTQKLVDTTPSKPPYLDNKVELHQFCSLTKK